MTWVVEWRDGRKRGRSEFADRKRAGLAALAYLAVLSKRCRVRVVSPDGVEVEGWGWRRYKPKRRRGRTAGLWSVTHGEC